MDVTEKITGIEFRMELGEFKAWRSYSFAPDWFADASREAKDKGRGPRRREILFAVCAAESYVLEWVRDTVLRQQDLEKLEEFFPAYDTRGVRDKLKEIPKKLEKPDVSPAHWTAVGRTGTTSTRLSSIATVWFTLPPAAPEQTASLRKRSPFQTRPYSTRWSPDGRSESFA